MSAAIDPAEVTLLVIAKEPIPGKAKTRLSPAVGAVGAARLAEAALADTLAAVAAAAAVRGSRMLLALDGSPGAWLPSGFEVVPQRSGGLGERLAGAFEDAGGPALLVGMDTPQLSAETVRSASEQLSEAGVDAVLGLADDGGWWALGLRTPDARAFDGVPMSESDTGAVQIQTLDALGLSTRRLGRMVDVDTIEDAIAVAASIPTSRFARTLREVSAAAAG